MSRIRSSHNAFLVSAVAVLTLCLTACGSGSSSKEEREQAQQKVNEATTVDALYALAKQEGEVEFWGPEDNDDMKALTAEFNKRFPGITVKHFETEAGDSVPKIAAEEKTGNLELDAVEGGLDTVQPLLDRDLVQAHDNWNVLAQPEGAVSTDKRLIDWYNIAHPVGINTKLLSLDQAPKTWDDLLQPQWKGKILLEPRCKTVRTLGATRGADGLDAYAKALKAQNPIYTSGGTATSEQLAAGQAPIAIGMYSYQVEELKAKGAPVDWVALDPTGANQTVVFTLKGAKHPAAAFLLAAWLGSEEGLAAHRKLTGKGSILEGPDAEKIKAAGAKVVIESAENSKQLGDFESRCAEIFGGKG